MKRLLILLASVFLVGCGANTGNKSVDYLINHGYDAQIVTDFDGGVAIGIDNPRATAIVLDNHDGHLDYAYSYLQPYRSTWDIVGETYNGVLDNNTGSEDYYSLVKENVGFYYSFDYDSESPLDEKAYEKLYNVMQNIPIDTTCTKFDYSTGYDPYVVRDHFVSKGYTLVAFEVSVDNATANFQDDTGESFEIEFNTNSMKEKYDNFLELEKQETDFEAKDDYHTFSIGTITAGRAYNENMMFYSVCSDKTNINKFYEEFTGLKKNAS